MRGFADSWMRYWFEPEEPFNLAVCRILCFWGLFVLHFQYDLSAWAAPPDPFWIPIPLFDSLNLTRPSAEVLFAMGLVWKLSLLASCIGLFTRASIVTAAVLGLYLLGLPHNFGKVDHNNAIEFFVFMIMAVSRCGDALSVDHLIARRRGKPYPPTPSGEYRWPVRCVWLVFALIFFAAGYSKLRNSGLAWVSSDYFQRLMASTDQSGLLSPLARQIARFGWLCKGLAAGTILLEVSYPLALVSRRARLVIVPGVFFMQAGIFLLMGIPFHAFVVCVIFWIPWDRVASLARHSWDRERIRRIARIEDTP